MIKIMKHMKKLNKEEIIKKWEATGFLDGLKGHVSDDIAKLFECCKSGKISDDIAKFDENVILRKIWKK